MKVEKSKHLRLLAVVALLASQLGNFTPAFADEDPSSSAQPSLHVTTPSESSSVEATPSSGSEGATVASSSEEASSGEVSFRSAPTTPSSQEVIKIGQIQGEAHESPFKGQKVAIENAVVTKTDRNGFYAQDIDSDGNARTSDAIYVVSKYKVKVGDKIKVTGTVKEGYMEEVGLAAGKAFTPPAGSLTVTMLVDAYITKDGKASLPEAINITAGMPQAVKVEQGYHPEFEALDYWESLEGMLTVVKQPQILGPQYRGDIYVLGADYVGFERNNIGGLNLRPQMQNTATIPIYVGNKFIAKAKDYFDHDVTGVVTYRGSIYKLEPIEQLTALDGGLQRQVAQTQPAEDKLTIASYNIENFSANAAKNETPEEKVNLIADSFIHEIHNPDIITLIEVQDNNGSVNDGTTSGVESGKKLADRIKERGGKAYEYTEVAPVDGADGGKPGSNIRLGVLYNPERVTLVKKEVAGATEAARFEGGHLVKNPARIAPENPAFEHSRKSLAVEFSFKGKPVVVIANHLKSKIGDDPIYGSVQPPVEHTQVARLEQARVINEFVKEGLRQNPETTFVLTGDFNDYEFSATAQAIAGNELTNLMATHTEADRYSYFYRGSNQVLDNIFVSHNRAAKAVFEPVHINASFMKEHGRASDHDPVLVQLDLSDAPTDEPTDTKPEIPSEPTPSNPNPDKSTPDKPTPGQPTDPHETTEEISANPDHQNEVNGEDSSDQTAPSSETSESSPSGKVTVRPSGKNKILPATGVKKEVLMVVGMLLFLGASVLKRKYSK